MNDVINKVFEKKVIEPALTGLKKKIKKNITLTSNGDDFSIRNYTVADVLAGIDPEKVYLGYFFERLQNLIFRDNRDAVAEKAVRDFIEKVLQGEKPAGLDFIDDDY